MRVLDHGFIRVVNVLGDDLTVVNAARVSYGKETTVFTPKDNKLIHYLLKHQHYSPFRHVMVQCHIKAPEFVTRQWYKHVVGIEATSMHPCKSHAFNEISGRYVQYNEYYNPEVFRAQSASSKQGSDGRIDAQTQARDAWDKAHAAMFAHYKHLLELGVAKEQARCVLPLSIYTEFYWTASLQAIMNLIELRDAPHAQWEIQQYAKALRNHVEDLFPACTKAWATVQGTAAADTTSSSADASSSCTTVGVAPESQHADE